MSAARFPLVDVDLSRRIERAEASANRRFVESRARHEPAIQACWTEAGGAYAMFDGVGSPVTQTFGLGMFEPVTAGTLDTLESFFTSRGSDVFHEISPLADPSTLSLLSARGYRPCELTSILFQPLPWEPVVARPGSTITARLSEPHEVDRWAEVAQGGWSDFPEFREFMASFTAVASDTEEAHRFFAFDGDRPIATGSLSVHGDVAIL